MMKALTSRRCGMTMIELVSALMLFIFILGGLTMALNKATSLWSSSHNNQVEEEKAALVLNLMYDDLQQAVTDNAPDIDDNEAPPTFLIDGEDLSNAGDVKIVLQFIRHRSYISRQTNKEPPALDAVFYTYYGDALFRHVIPLAYTDVNQPEHIGNLLGDIASTITPSLHTQILDGTPPSNGGTFSVLARNIHQPVIIAGIPAQHSNNAPESWIFNESATLSNNIRTLPEYKKLESKVLPDYIFFAIRIFSETEWAAYNKLLDSGDQVTISRKEPYFGKTVSRRISFQTTRGARLK